MAAGDKDVSEASARSIKGARGGLMGAGTTSGWLTFTVTEYVGRYVKIVPDTPTGFWHIFSTDDTPATAVDETATETDAASEDATIPDSTPSGVFAQEVVPGTGQGASEMYLHVKCINANSNIRVRPS